jgi:hypothetical protein
MKERVAARFDLEPDRLIGDTDCGSAATPGSVVDKKQIEPVIRSRRVPVN